MLPNAHFLNSKSLRAGCGEIHKSQDSARGEPGLISCGTSRRRPADSEGGWLPSTASPAVARGPGDAASGGPAFGAPSRAVGTRGPIGRVGSCGGRSCANGLRARADRALAGGGRAQRRPGEVGIENGVGKLGLRG